MGDHVPPWSGVHDGTCGVRTFFGSPVGKMSLEFEADSVPNFAPLIAARHEQ